MTRRSLNQRRCHARRTVHRFIESAGAVCSGSGRSSRRKHRLPRSALGSASGCTFGSGLLCHKCMVHANPSGCKLSFSGSVGLCHLCSQACDIVRLRLRVGAEGLLSRLQRLRGMAKDLIAVPR